MSRTIFTTNFVYFTMNNSNRNFLTEIFGERMGKHFESKFNSFLKKDSYHGAMLRLFTEMDSDNQKTFLEWINENYSFSKSQMEAARK